LNFPIAAVADSFPIAEEDFAHRAKDGAGSADRRNDWLANGL